MFDYPLPIPRNTHYQELGIAPEATLEEVREAKEEAVKYLEGQQNDASKALDEIYEHVPGLKEAYRHIGALQTSHGKKVSGKPDSVQGDLVEMEKKAMTISPYFKELRDRFTELDKNIKRINAVALDNPETRAAYDAANPPLALLRLADCTSDKFTDNKVAMHLLRHELSKFLAKHRDKAFHASDLTREDFTSDFTPNELLDGADYEQFKT